MHISENILKTTKLDTLNELILWYVNYILIKVFFKTFYFLHFLKHKSNNIKSYVEVKNMNHQHKDERGKKMELFCSHL